MELYLRIDGSGNRTNEVVWSDGSNPYNCRNRWGGGSGNSQVFRRPQWQNASGVNNQFSRGTRQIPDIAAVAFDLADYGNNGMNAYYDVTSGTNLYYPATPGWDYSTGLGTPNLANFYTAISSKIK